MFVWPNFVWAPGVMGGLLNLLFHSLKAFPQCSPYAAWYLANCSARADLGPAEFQSSLLRRTLITMRRLRMLPAVEVR